MLSENSQHEMELMAARLDSGRKKFYNYVLLDPTYLADLFVNERKYHEMLHSTKGFEIFISAIFYIGKGEGVRATQHMRDALKWMEPKDAKKAVTKTGNVSEAAIDAAPSHANNEKNGEASGETTTKTPTTRGKRRSNGSNDAQKSPPKSSPEKEAPEKEKKKLERIVDIWRREAGIITVKLFPDSHSAQSKARESCMIDAIEKKDDSRQFTFLLNINRGDNLDKKWDDLKDKIGSYLLFKAYQSYLINQPQVIKYQDAKQLFAKQDEKMAAVGLEQLIDKTNDLAADVDKQTPDEVGDRHSVQVLELTKRFASLTPSK